MLIAVVIVLVIVILVLLGVLIWKCTGNQDAMSIQGKSGKEKKIYISNKGADADSGSLGGCSGELFKGTSKEKIPTMVLSGELAATCGHASSRYTIRLRSVSHSREFQGNFVREIKIGRAVTGNGQSPVLLLPFSSVSRIHCRVFAEGNQIYVEDLNSSYRTYVNNVRIVKPEALHSGDELTLGYEKFYVEI